MENQVVFRDIQIRDYQESWSLLSFLTKTNEDFSLESFSRVCSSLDSNHRIVCGFCNDIESGDQVMIAMGTIFIERKLIHNCSCVAHIEDVVVHEKYRNMNFGKILIDHLINIAKKRQAYKVTLNCSEEKMGFYQKCGFYKSNVEMRINI